MLKWTDEPPTQDGWYFVRSPWMGKPGKGEPLSVKYVDAANLAGYLRMKEEYKKEGVIEEYRYTQWAGPIEEPEEKEA